MLEGKRSMRRAIPWLLLGAVLFAGCRPAGIPAYLVDAQGRVAIYHGVNVSNSSKNSDGMLPWQTREDFARLNEWGFNMVRYLVFWEAIEPQSGTYDDRYIANTVERIKWLQDLGIDVLIDVHQDLYARRFSGNGFPSWAIDDEGIPFHPREPWNLNYLEPAVMTSYDNFWRSRTLKASYVTMLEHLLKAIDGLPNVAGLEIMNEPWPWLGPGFEPDALTGLYEDVLAMKKRNGFRTRLFFEPVIFTSGGLPSRLRFRPGPECAYSFHYYDPFCHEGRPYSSFGHWLMGAAMNFRVKEALRFGTPMLCTEFGISPETEGFAAYLGDFLDHCDAVQAGWVYYSYDKSTVEGFGIVDGDGRPTPLLDHLVQVYPQRIAGRNITWRRGANSFDLAYDATGTQAPTEIFVPASCLLRRVVINGEEQPVELQSRKMVHVNAAQGGRETIHLDWE